MATDADTPLGRAERARLDALRDADSLAALVALTAADSEHDAYFAAKREWRRLRGRELAAEPVETDGVPGTRVAVGDTTYWVHGVTHADTDAERAFLREHVADALAAGHGVYCEQGIRSMYFADFEDVCAMDDYRWAMARCREFDPDSHVEAFDGVVEDVAALASDFREAAFSLVSAGGEYYGEDVQSVLGDVATSFLTSHADAATGQDFESFALSKAAAEDPSRLRDLQQYYLTEFLPQPVEREWLRRYDRELEVLTHARNERIADYAVYHADTAATVHLFVGAAHQPGVAYYLREHAAGDRTLDGFEPTG
jgi:hypothetical protein